MICAAATACGFIPLHGERDEEHQFGVTIPYRGWVLDADNFQTNVVNFLRPQQYRRNRAFFPITISQAVIRGWELTLRSPRYRPSRPASSRLFEPNRGRRGTITGGLTDFSHSLPDLTPARSRPAQHAQRGWRRHASLAQLCLDQRLLRLRLLQRLSRRADPGDYLPAAHHLRSFSRTKISANGSAPRSRRFRRRQ